MSYVPAGFTPEQETELLTRTAEIVARQQKEERSRKLTLIIGGLGALFAAARLGVIAIPLIQERRRRRRR